MAQISDQAKLQQRWQAQEKDLAFPPLVSLPISLESKPRDHTKDICALPLSLSHIYREIAKCRLTCL